MMTLIKTYSLILSAFLSALITFFIVSYFYNIRIDKLNKEADEVKISILKQKSYIDDKYKKLQEKTKEQESKDYEKFSKLQDDNQKLLSDVSNANRKLRIKISSCSTTTTGEANTSIVGNESTSTGVIDSRDAESIISITNKADKYKSQLEALQNYINTYNKNINSK